MTIQEDFRILTQTHPVTVIDPDTGGISYQDEPALLDELRDAVFGGKDATRQMSGFRAKLPISAGAFDLYEMIDTEITTAWAQLHPERVPGVDKLERLLAQVVSVAQPDQHIVITVAEQRIDNPGTKHEHWWVDHKPVTYTLDDLMKRWVRLIREYFTPPRTAEIQAPCLQCDEEWAWKRVDGENVRYRVLVFIRNEAGDSLEARCLACGASWRRDQFRFLLEALQDRHAETVT